MSVPNCFMQINFLTQAHHSSFHASPSLQANKRKPLSNFRKREKQSGRLRNAGWAQLMLDEGTSQSGVERCPGDSYRRGHEGEKVLGLGDHRTDSQISLLFQANTFIHSLLVPKKNRSSANPLHCKIYNRQTSNVNIESAYFRYFIDGHKMWIS